MAIAEPPLAPPHDLEAEQSVLGAIFLTDVSLYGLVIQDGLRPRTSTASSTASSTRR